MFLKKLKKKKSLRDLNDKTSQKETDIKKTSLKIKSSKIANKLVRYVLFLCVKIIYKYF